MSAPLAVASRKHLQHTTIVALAHRRLDGHENACRKHDAGKLGTPTLPRGVVAIATLKGSARSYGLGGSEWPEAADGD